VPLPVKLLKLLISDVQNAIEAQTASQQEEEEGSDEEEEEVGSGGLDSVTSCAYCLTQQLLAVIPC